MSEVQAMTHRQALEMMIFENKNEIVKCELLERLYARQLLRGKHPGVIEQMIGKNQSYLANMKASLADLEDIHKAILEEEAQSVVQSESR